MPLENGKSQAIVSRNIARERDAGKPERQAIAIAESKAREAKDCGAMDDRSVAMSEVCRLIAILTFNRSTDDDVAFDRALTQDEAEGICAFDAEHWISTESGSHLLIEGTEGGGFTIKGGAGGKMDGRKVSPKSMSANRINEKSSQFNNHDFKPNESSGGSEKPKAPIHPDHHRLANPLKIERETEKAYATKNPDYEAAKEHYAWGGNHSLSMHASQKERDAYKNGESLSWFPKSHSSAHEGYIHGMSPWLASKSGQMTEERTQKRENAFQEGKANYAALLAKAKAAGVKGVRVGMRASTIRGKMMSSGVAADCMALDRGSVRTMDDDGRMHVAVSNISKATVNPYLGSEIPDAERLGLDPNKIYQLFRDPKELEAAASTFNNIPLLSEHVPVSAADHRPELVVGATGSDAEFKAPYLRNSLVIWAKDAIDGVNSDEQRELSCAYRYTAIMEPGTYEGQPYDGRMVDLRGNHVAIVPNGRAGPDVMVNDHLPEILMSKSRLSPKAILAKGALTALVRPKLAADAKVDFTHLVRNVTSANWAGSKAGIIAAIKPKLAADADIEDLVKLLDGLDGEEAEITADEGDEVDEKKKPVAEDDEEDVEGMDDDVHSETDEEAVWRKLYEAIGKMLNKEKPEAAMDEPPEFKGKPAAPDKEKPEVTKTAMDSAIRAAAANAEKSTIARINGIHAAEKAVHPFVGELAVACDSADAVYKAALDILEVDVKGVHPSAYRHILEAQRKPGEHRAAVQSFAQDAAASAEIDKMFPNASRVKTI